MANLIYLRRVKKMCNLANTSPKFLQFVILVIISMQPAEEEDYRRQRDQQVVEIRRQNRKELFAMKRRMNEARNEEFQPQVSQSVLQEEYREFIDLVFKQNLGESYLEALADQLRSEDFSQKLRAAVSLRNIIANCETQQTIQRLIDTGAVPVLISNMRDSFMLQLQFQSLWIITNIAAFSTSYCASIVEKNGIEAIINILNENKHDLIVKQGLWALGNIAADADISFRNRVIHKGGVDTLERIVSNSENQDIVRIGSWVISTLMRGKPKPNFSYIKRFIPLMAQILVATQLSPQEQYEIIWALACNCKDQPKHMAPAMKIPGFIPKLFQLCDNDDTVLPALRLLGNFSNGSEKQTDELLSFQILDLLYDLLQSRNLELRSEACWILSNLVGGSSGQIRQVLDRLDILGKLTEMLFFDDMCVKTEICFFFGNICYYSIPEVILDIMLDFKIIQAFAEIIMQDDDIKAIQIALTNFVKIFSLQDRLNDNDYIIRRAVQNVPSFTQRIEALQHHDSTIIYGLISKIITKYFVIEQTLPI